MKYVTRNYLSILALSLLIVIPEIYFGTSYALSCMEASCANDTECETGYCHIDTHTCVNRDCMTDPDCTCSSPGGCNRNCDTSSDCDENSGLVCIMTSAGVKACRCSDDEYGIDAYCTTCGGALPTPSPTPTSSPGACNQSCIAGATYPNSGSCNSEEGLMCYSNKCRHKDCLLDDNCICSTAGVCNAWCGSELGCTGGRVCREPAGLGCGNPDCIEDTDCTCERGVDDGTTGGSCFLGDDGYYRKLNCSGRCSSIPSDETGVSCIACGAPEDDSGVCATQPNGEIFDSCCPGSVPELNDSGECVCKPTKDAVYRLFTNINGLMIPITIILGIFLIVLKGYKIMTSQGDPQQLQEGKEGLTSAIIGLIFVLLAVSILRVIIKALISGDADPFGV